jgi:ribose transport system permease protein
MIDHVMIDHVLSPTIRRACRAALARIPGVTIMLVGLVVVFASTAARFLSVANISNVLLQSVILLVLALPMTLVIMTEGLDLSMGAVLTFASVVLATVVGSDGSLAVALLIGVAVGGAFGMINGGLVAFAGIPPFVGTLGTLGVAQGLANVVTDGQSVTAIPDGFGALYASSLLGLPVPIWIGIAAYVAIHALLYHTRFGNYVFALGGNRDALRLAGGKPERVLIAVYALAGGMAGLAGFLMTARISAAHPTSGIGLEFDAIAAVALGGTSFERGNGWLFGTLFGVLTVGVLRNGLNLVSIASSGQVVCVGLLVILALFVDGRRRSRG